MQVAVSSKRLSAAKIQDICFKLPSSKLVSSVFILFSGQSSYFLNLVWKRWRRQSWPSRCKGSSELQSPVNTIRWIFSTFSVLVFYPFDLPIFWKKLKQYCFKAAANVQCFVMGHLSREGYSLCTYVKNVYEVCMYMTVGTKPSMSVCYVCAYTLHMKYDCTAKTISMIYYIST